MRLLPFVLLLALLTGCSDSISGTDDELVTFEVHRIVFGGHDGHAFQVGPIDPLEYWTGVGATCFFVGETARIADPDEIPGFPIPTVLYDQTWECEAPAFVYTGPGSIS